MQISFNAIISYLCEFTTLTHKFKSLFCTEKTGFKFLNLINGKTHIWLKLLSPTQPNF